MKEKFDYYDVFSGLIPGALCILLGYYMIYGDMEEVLKNIHSLSVGGSLVFCIIVYLLGEFVQVPGKMLEWCLLRVIGGMPSTWIAVDAKGLFLSYRKRRIGVTQAQIDLISKKFANGKQLDTDTLKKVFSMVKDKCYERASTRTEMDKILAKASMHRGLMTIAFLYAGYHLVMHEASFGLKSAAALVAFVLFFWRFMYFYIRYAEHLYSGYCYMIEEGENDGASGSACSANAAKSPEVPDEETRKASGVQAHGGRMFFAVLCWLAVIWRMRKRG